ncbi:MAG: toxin-antitoxin system HicB family antitoxin [Thermodesulfobacteriota bacterium]
MGDRGVGGRCAVAPDSLQRGTISRPIQCDLTNRSTRTSTSSRALRFANAPFPRSVAPFKGTFNVRVSPEIHRKAAMLAGGRSLNAFVAEALAEKIERASA